MTDTCINYQTMQAPIRNEHVAFGDTGVVIYSNSVCGALSNFEGGPSALAAGLTGRTPRYGFHLPEQRRATAAYPRRVHARDAQRLGRARRRDRPHRRQLLGGAGDRGHRRRAALGSAQAFRRGDGELRLDRAVPHGRRHAGSRPARRRRARRSAEPSHRPRRGEGAAGALIARTARSMSWCSRRRSSASTSCAISPRCAPTAASPCRCWR